MSLSFMRGLIYVKPVQDGSDTTIALVGRMSTSDIERLCERAHDLLLSARGVIVCDVGALIDPDVVSVDAIARLQLLARRSGRELRLRNAPAELRKLLDLAGLADVIPVSSD